MKILLTLFLSLISVNSFAWVISADFEQGAVGSPARGDDAFDNPKATTVISADRAISGKQSAISTIRQGDDGFRDWGGQWSFPSELAEGDEIWYRVWVYYPAGFDFSCGCPEGIKFMRIRTYSQQGAYEGSWDYYLRADGAVMATGLNQEAFYKINHPYPFDDIRGIGGPITTGVWHAFEHYIKFSATAGQGIIRAWLDGRLIFEDRVTPTLVSPTSKVSQATLWTYWNNMAPRTQSAYVDDVIITNEAPSARDDQGNLFVGTGDVSFAFPPKPPVIVK